MHAMLLLIASTTPAVDFGWQPGPDGQMEYIIQIEPDLVDALRDGAVVVSEIHPDIQNVRRFRIQLGTGELPRVTTRSALDPPLPANHEVVESATVGSPAVPASRPPLLDRAPAEQPAPVTSEPSRFSRWNLPGDTVAPSEATVQPPDRFAVPPRTNPDTAPEPRLTVDAHQPQPLATEPQRDPASSQPLWPPPRDPNGFPTRSQFEPSAPINDRFGTVTGGQTAVTASSPGSDGTSVIAAPNTNVSTPPPRTVAMTPDNTVPNTIAPLATSAPVAPSAPAETPWIPFVVTLLGLFASLSGNAYLGWISYGAVMRYRDLVADITLDRRTA